MSTLAERSASQTYNQFYGAVPIDQVITAKSIRALSESPQTERSILFDQVGSFQNAHTELTAASLLQERFGVPLCLAAVQPFLVLLSKEQQALDWERLAGLQLIDQLRSMTQIALARLAEIETIRQQKEQDLAALMTTAKDLQADPLHQSVSGLANRAKQLIEKEIEQMVRSLSDLQQESRSLGLAVLEFSMVKQAATSELTTFRKVKTLSLALFQ